MEFPIHATDLRFGYTIDLDGRDYRVVFWFNSRDDFAAGTDGAWYLDLYDAAGDPLVLGTRLSLGRDKWRRYRHIPGMPQGQLSVRSQSGREATSTSLGGDVVVEYE